MPLVPGLLALVEYGKLRSTPVFVSSCLSKVGLEPGVVVHSYNPSTWEAEARGLLQVCRESRPHSGCHNETYYFVQLICANKMA